MRGNFSGVNKLIRITTDYPNWFAGDSSCTAYVHPKIDEVNIVSRVDQSQPPSSRHLAMIEPMIPSKKLPTAQLTQSSQANLTPGLEIEEQDIAISKEHNVVPLEVCRCCLIINLFGFFVAVVVWYLCGAFCDW